MTTWYKCNSCGGVYPGDNYYHVCPPDTQFPRDENIDDSDWHPTSAAESKKPRPIKRGKPRLKGGAKKVSQPEVVTLY